MADTTTTKAPVSVRVMITAGDLERDAAAIDQIANRLVDDYGDDEKLLALGRRLRRHAGALTGMAWEIDRSDGGES